MDDVIAGSDARAYHSLELPPTPPAPDPSKENVYTVVKEGQESTVCKLHCRLNLRCSGLLAWRTVAWDVHETRRE